MTPRIVKETTGTTKSSKHRTLRNTPPLSQAPTEQPTGTTPWTVPGTPIATIDPPADIAAPSVPPGWEHVEGGVVPESVPLPTGGSAHPIEDGVPFPVISRGRPEIYQFAHMEVSQSFFVPGKKISSMSNVAAAAGRRHGMRFQCATTTKDGVSGVRVWRVA